MKNKIFMILFYVFLLVDMGMMVYLFLPPYVAPEPDSKYCEIATCDCTTRGNNGKCKCEYCKEENCQKKSYVFCKMKDEEKKDE